MDIFFDEPLNDDLDAIEMGDDVDIDLFDPEEFDTSMKEGADDNGFVEDDFSL